MADASDLLAAWRDTMRQLGGLARSAAGQAGQIPEILAALQRQADVVEQMLRRQIEFEQELVKRALAPAQATAEALEKTPDALRAQAAAFRAAAASFSQAADVVEVQARAVEQTLAALKAPVDVARWGLGRLPGSGQPDGEA